MNFFISIATGVVESDTEADDGSKSEEDPTAARALAVWATFLCLLLGQCLPFRLLRSLCSRLCSLHLPLTGTDFVSSSPLKLKYPFFRLEG